MYPKSTKYSSSRCANTIPEMPDENARHRGLLKQRHIVQIERPNLPNEVLHVPHALLVIFPTHFLAVQSYEFRVQLRYGLKKRSNPTVSIHVPLSLSLSLFHPTYPTQGYLRIKIPPSISLA